MERATCSLSSQRSRRLSQLLGVCAGMKKKNCKAVKREGDFTGEKKRTPEYINRQGENYVLLDEEMFLLSWKWRL